MSPITNSFCSMYGRKHESLHQAQWPRCGHISFVKWVSWLSFIEYSLCLEHVVITVLGRSSHRGVGRVSAQVESDSPSSLGCIPSLGKAGRPIRKAFALPSRCCSRDVGEFASSSVVQGWTIYLMCFCCTRLCHGHLLSKVFMHSSCRNAL